MAQYEVPDFLFKALIQQESGGKASAVSSKGARGLTQLMPDTMRDPGFGIAPARDSSNEENLRVGREYLQAMLNRYDGDVAKSLAAYNAGPGAVDKYKGVPPYMETKKYVKNILAMASKYASQMAPISSAQANEQPYQGDNTVNATEQHPEAVNVDWNSLPDAPTQPEAVNVDWNSLPDAPSQQDEQPAQPEPQAKEQLPQGNEPLKAMWGGPGETIQTDKEGKYIEDRPQGKYYGRDISSMSPVSQLLVGAGNTVMDFGRGIKQRYDIGDQAKLQQEVDNSASLNAELGKTSAGTLGSIIGGSAPLVLGAPATIPGAVGAAALYGASQPTTSGNGSENEQVAKNMALTGGTTLALGGLSKAVGGFTPSESAKKLMAEGVQPTVGQGIDQSGTLGKMVRKAEESATSPLVFGATTRNARERAGEEWVKKRFDSIEIPGVITAKGKTGAEGLTELHKSFQTAYNGSLEGHKIPIKPELSTKIDKLIKNKANFLTDSERQSIRAVVAEQFGAVPQVNGKITAKDVHKIESALSQQARTFANGDAHEQSVAHVLDSIEWYITQYRNSHLPEEVTKGVKAIDSKYARYKRLERAVVMGDPEGKISPSGLLRAVKALDTSPGKGKFGRGEALMQKEAVVGQMVLPETLANSGTPIRTQTGNVLSSAMSGGLPEVGAATILGPTISAGILAAMGLGQKRQVQKALLGGYGLQKPVSESAQKYVKKNAVPIANLLLHYATQNEAKQ
jgi:hypothetical protein